MRGPTEDFLSRQRTAGLEILTDRLVETIVADNDGYRTVPVVPLEDLRRSCRDNISRVLELLALSFSGEDVSEGPWYDAARETGRRRASQGLPLDDVLGSFRIGGRLIWEALLADAGPEIDESELREIGTHLWEVVDRTSSQVARAYHAEERSLVRVDEQRSAALWEELLRGRGREPRFAAMVAQTLDLPVEGPFVVAAVSGAAGDVGRQLHGMRVRSAWHQRTDLVAGVLATGGRPVTELRSRLRECRVRGGLSAEVAGLADVPSAFGEATLALRSLPPGVPEVAIFEERLTEGLLLGSPEIAHRLVEQWLGPVLALPEAEGRVLVQTLRAWVDAGGAMTRTAELAHCHRNTAMNRLVRVGEMLGRPLVDAPPSTELDLALRWLRLRG